MVTYTRPIPVDTRPAALRAMDEREGVAVDLLKAAERVIVDVAMCPKCNRVRVTLITGDVVCGCGVDSDGRI